MDAMEVMGRRHSVRAYIDSPLEGAALDGLRSAMEAANAAGGLTMELILDDGSAFDSMLGRYGKFSGVRNLVVVKGPKSRGLRGRAGYWGERLVLDATELGLGTCWVAGTYSKKGIRVGPGEELVCVITVGRAERPGKPHASKPMGKFIAGRGGDHPSWFISGVEAAMLAPTAMNQQKFAFARSGDVVDARVSGPGFYADLDLGIAACHFELGAGAGNFAWKESPAG